MNIKQKRLAFLNDEISFRNLNNRSTTGAGGISCLYGGIGCAIGRRIEDKELCRTLDNHLKSWISKDTLIFALLPADLKELGIDFLAKMQRLHDDSSNWTAEGLSDFGRDEINQIKSLYC